MKSIRSLSCLGALCVLASPTRAADIVWTNASGGLWSAATNWSPNQVPGGSDSAFITNPGAYSVTLRGPVSVARLELGDGTSSQVLRLEGGTGTGTTTFTVANGFTNHGIIELSSTNSAWAARLVLTSGTLVNAEHGVIRSRAGAGGTRTLDLALINSGELQVEADTTLTSSGDRCTNSGVFRLKTGNLAVNLGSSGVFHNSGTLELGADKELQISGGSVTLAASTVLAGSGTLDFATTTEVNLGRDFTLRPGESRLSFSGRATVNGPGAIINGDTLTLGGDTLNTALVNEQNLFVRGAATVAGAFANAGMVLLEGGTGTGNTTFTVANGFTNQGTIELSSTNAAWAARLVVTSGALVNAEGRTIRARVGAGGTRTLDLPLINLGDLQVDADTTLNTMNDRSTNSGAFRLKGGNLTVNLGSSGTFHNSGTLELGNGDELQISGGSVVLASSTVLSGTGTLDFGSITDVYLGRGFTLQPGEAKLSFSGRVTVDGTGTITNRDTLTLGSDTLNIPLVNEQMLFVRGVATLNGTFANTGMLRLEGGTGTGNTTCTIANGFTNQGTIELSSTNSGWASTLAVNNGALVNAEGRIIRARAAAGGTRTLDLSLVNFGELLVETNLTLTTGAGGVTNAGTFRLTGGNLTINQIAASASYNTGTFEMGAGNELQISGGSMTLAAGTLLAGTGTLDFAGTTEVNLGRDFTLLPGEVQMSLSGRVTVNGPGSLINRHVLTLGNDTVNTALMNEQSLWVRGNATLNDTFVNTGTLRLEGGNGTGNTAFTIAGGFTNQGTIELSSTNAGWAATLAVNSGTLVNAQGHGIAVRAGSGGLRILNLALLNLGELLVEANTTINRSAARHTNAGTIRLGNGASLGFAAGTSLENTRQGIITGSGTLDLDFVSFGNSGAVEPGNPLGALAVQGAYRQDFDAALNIDLGGNTPVAQYDRLDVNGPAVLDGAINVRLVGGFIPKVGDTFQVMTFKSRTGDFTFWNGLNQLAPNLRLEPSYTTNALNLTVVPLPSPYPTLSYQRRGSELLVFWPTEFEAWRLLSGTNIQTTSVTNASNEVFSELVIDGWSDYATTATNRTMLPPIETQRYFLLIKP